MKLPEFTAEMSLYWVAESYYAATNHNEIIIDARSVLPQAKRAIIFRWRGQWCVGVEDSDTGQSYVAGCADTAGWR